MVHDHDWQNEPPVDFNKSYDEHYGDEEDEALPERKRFFLIRDVHETAKNRLKPSQRAVFSVLLDRVLDQI